MFATQAGLVLKPPVTPVLGAYQLTWSPYTNGNVSSMVINPPTGIVAGDLLFVMASISSQADDIITWSTISAPAGWTTLVTVTSPPQLISYTLMYKVADGSEAAITCGIAPVQRALNACSYYCRITGANLTTPVNAAGSAVGTPPATVLSIPQFAVGPAPMPLDFLFAVSNGWQSNLQITTAGYTQTAKHAVINDFVGHEVAFGNSASTAPGANNITTVSAADIGGVQVSFANA